MLGWTPDRDGGRGERKSKKKEPDWQLEGRGGRNEDSPLFAQQYAGQDSLMRGGKVSLLATSREVRPDSRKREHPESALASQKKEIINQGLATRGSQSPRSRFVAITG